MKGRFYSQTPALRRLAGFTLAEMLLSIAVSALLLALLFQVASQSIALTNFNSSRMTASDEARIVFDRMNLDWENRVQYAPSQVGIARSSTVVNDELWWNSYVPATVSGRGFASCDYKIAIDSITSKLALQRATEVYGWTATPSANILVGTNLFMTTTVSQPVSTDFQTLSSGVLRMAVTPVANNSTAARVNSVPSVGGTTYIGSPSYLGFYVTIVSIDQATLAKLSSARVSQISSLFTNATSANSTMQAWQTMLTTGGTFTSLERGHLLVSERYYNRDQ